MLRSRLVPITQVSINLSQFVINAGFCFMGFGGGSQSVFLIGVVLFAISTLFTLVTLAVEFDASAKESKWLDISNISKNMEYDQAKDALKWAAITYVDVVTALSFVAMLVYYIMIYSGRNRD